MSEIAIYIGEDGSIEHVYDDAVADLFAEDGTAITTRASHVEPAPQGGWNADMGPVGGPVLGPFALRADALAAERRWLDDNYFPQEVR